jgi:hypothetical protein
MADPMMPRPSTPTRRGDAAGTAETTEANDADEADEAGERLTVFLVLI